MKWVIDAYSYFTYISRVFDDKVFGKVSVAIAINPVVSRIIADLALKYFACP